MPNLAGRGAVPNFLASALAIVALASLSVFYLHGQRGGSAALVLDYQSSVATAVQVFFDTGAGIREEDSTRRLIPMRKDWKELRLDLPEAKILHLRLDPAETEGRFGFRNLRVVDADGHVRLQIPLSSVKAAQQIASMAASDGELQIQTSTSANDPILEIVLPGPIDLRRGLSLGLLRRIAAWTAFWAAIAGISYRVPRLLLNAPLLSSVRRRPWFAVWLAAIAGTILSMSPVIFQGRSLMSPNTGALLLYDHFPTLPNYSDSETQNVHGADVGAMEWAHFPQTVVQERALRVYHEFPLWNRYNSSGTSMIGQGQMMLGDPFNWAMWLVGVGAESFDIKFVLLRVLFAATLGLAVFTLTRELLPAGLLAAVAPFIGYFVFRVNHPAIFTLCYAPLISLAWIKFIYSTEDRSRLTWICGLMLANWLVLNSGTVKEAYAAIVLLNSMGVGHLFLERSRFTGHFRTFLPLLMAGALCFLMIASPVWGSLFDAIKNGTSSYHQPQVQSFPTWYFLGFADNFYYLLRIHGYFPSINPLLFAASTIPLLCLKRLERVELRRSVLALALGAASAIALAFGLIPQRFLLAIPYLNNIVHLHNTFSTVLIIPALLLAGVGFHIVQVKLVEAKSYFFYCASLFFVLLFLFVLSFSVDSGLPLRRFAVYSFAVVPSAILSAWLLPALIRGRLPFGTTCFCLLFVVLALARQATYAKNPNDYVLNLGPRVALTYRPQLVARFVQELSNTPMRVVGLGDVLVPGYNATLDLETISGPDAMMNRRYRELTAALKLPYTDWGWRLYFTAPQLQQYKQALDLLNVGVILSSSRLPDPNGLEYEDGDGDLLVYVRRSAWPRAFFANRIVSYNSVNDIAERVSRSAGGLFVAVDQRHVADDPNLKQLIEHAEPSESRVVEATDYALTSNTTSFSINAPGPGVVYLGETDEPGGFVATVNGRNVPYVTANYAFKALVITEAGHYRVTFRYWPAHFALYLWLAGVGLFFWVAILVVCWRRFGRQGATFDIVGSTALS